MKFRYTEVGMFLYNIRGSIKSTFLGWRFPFLKPYIKFTGNKLWKLEHKYPLYAYEDEELVSIKQPFWVKIRYNLLYALQRIWPVSYSYWYCIPEGWRKAFGLQMCKELKAYADKGYRWHDCKEKFGRLTIYDTYGNTVTNKILHKYEYISSFTCIKCGKVADGLTTGWISPYCDNCKPEFGQFVYFGYKRNPFYNWIGNINNLKNWKELEKEYDEYYEKYA